jgi:ABC-type nitrate/sulfonate/bicarbonate transport system permease component
MSLKWLTAIRGGVPKPASIALGLVPVALLLLVWWLMTAGPVEKRAIAPNILPSPVEVVRSIPDLVRSDTPPATTTQGAEADFRPGRNLPYHTWVSFRRVLMGYLLALAIVAPLGILMGSLGSVRATLTPVTTASGYIPIATLVPLTMSWFGIGEKQKVIFLALAFGIYLLPLIVNSIAAVPDVYLRTAYTLGASRLQIIGRVLIPVALPDIWQGMRLAFGVGWTYLVLAEVIVLEDGLGVLVAQSQRRGPREHIYLVILVITLIAWLADLIWVRVGEAIRYRHRILHRLSTSSITAPGYSA